MTDEDAFVGPSIDDLTGPCETKVKTGKFSVNDDGLFTTYWHYEPLEETNKTPIICLHGGPGFTHNYILPMKLLCLKGYSTIFYDQCGCGASSFVKDPKKDAPQLLTVDFYVQELAKLVQELQLTRFYVYGSSWGSMLAQEFALTKPHGLEGLILDGALCDSQYYITTQWRDVLAPNVPKWTLDLLRKLEQNGDYDHPAYKAIDKNLSAKFTMRCAPKPQPYLLCLKTQNEVIYREMQGPSEFTIGGVLKNWSVKDKNPLVTVPVLVMAGQFDTMSQACHQQVVDSFPFSFPLITIPRAAHCKLLDEPHLCCDAMAKFLNTVELMKNKK